MISCSGVNRDHRGCYTHPQEETAQMDVEMEQYDAELASHGGWPASRDDTVYL